ncbi:uncharacterized protein LOC9641429 [Selaginella moellendorffii]|uniref:uncharacterized protein LOC9641429 n=1 Tax=Selaginella moellendorffii TaxID=88036 RepID=UPI000D1D031F|nr:uncharacterized protein LOC9641429 [Selaginella moellendorffii]|eukprot:XP_002960939.2 uncharacterized protein LOC9641429 [Selaginella moellendorffii]
MSSKATDRVVIHLDVDCFYAQSEILRRPWLRDRPVGVTQKFLVVTSNYVARQLGVPKMVPVDEAKRCCSDLVLINGEDLTPYRYASKLIMEVIKRFGTVEKRGLDECAVDVTEEVLKRVASANPTSFVGHVLGGDLTTQATQGDLLLMVGTQLAAEIRCAVEKETGYQCSCGISHNKMLAKMACSLNKPNKQTCITQSAVNDFIVPLPVCKIPGVGRQTEATLKEMGVETMGDMQSLTLAQLSSKFGDRFGNQLFDACRGHDYSRVQDKGFSKSLSVEDSFKPCSSLDKAKEILSCLAPDLIARLDEDKAETERTPKTFTVKWKSRGVWKFTSTSAGMPAELLLATVPLGRRTQVLVETGLRLLSQSLQGREFCVLNIGATNFIKDGSPSSADIRSFMARPCNTQSGVSPTQVLGKRQARIEREESTHISKVSVCIPASSSSPTEFEEDAEDVSADSFKYPFQVPGPESRRIGLENNSCCSQCGVEFLDERTKQQHLDFHLALQLQKSENRWLDAITPPRKKRQRNGTLDFFLLK